ncbi:amidohydrolase family protein [Acidobacteriota bacterium]
MKFKAFGGLGILVLVSFLFVVICCSTPSEHYDLIIKDTTIVDGTGKSSFEGSIAIKGDKIEAVGKVKGTSDVVIDGSGLVTCPGFIDPHNHSDFTITQFPEAKNFIQQGITTVLGGHCGGSPAPTKDLTFGDWLNKLEEMDISINLAMMAGHNTIRELVMVKDFHREATEEEVAEMKILLEEAMNAGAFGLSGGVDPPWSGYFASIEEKAELGKVVAQYGGFYSPHQKHARNHWMTDNMDEYSYVLAYGPAERILVGKYQGVMEAIEVCRRAGIPLHISHYKNPYVLALPHPNYLEEAAARAAMDLLQKANEEGVTVTCDVVLPPRAKTVKTIADEFRTERFNYPDWLWKLSREELAEKLKSKEFRAKIRELYDACKVKFSMIHTKIDPYWMNCIKVLQCQNKEFEGKLISEIARMRNTDPLDAVFDIIVEDPDAKWYVHWDRRSNQIAISTMLQSPLCEPCTDDFAMTDSLADLPFEPTASGAVTAIAFGMIPYYIKTYVKELGKLTLEEAIKKATSQPAKRLGLNRGILSSGAYADVVIFNFDTIDMKVDLLHPDHKPEGIECVIVNGKIAYKDNAHTGVKSGKVLRKSS